jgi:4-amino-4-deoxy-L-arabinose transferase-like glycosyltransferase
MEKPLSKIYPQKWTQIGILIGFCLVLFFFNLNCWDLWSPDEPRYAEVSREMVNGGDWILMHYNGNVYPDKPPLFFWLIGLSSYLWQGFTPFSVRFPSAFLGTLTVLLVFFFGKILYGSRIGFLSSLILATNVEFFYLSTRANIDTTLTFFTTVSLFCFFQWYQYRPLHPRIEYRAGSSPLPQGERERMRGSLSIYGLYIGMAFATLAKGPVGFILPLLVSLVYLILQKDWRGIKEMRLFTGMLMFLGIVLCWYLPAVWKGGRDYLSQTLFLHSIARYSSGWAKAQPIYFYLYDFPGSFLPWIVFLPSAFVYAYSRKQIKKNREFFFLVLWFAVIFIFFSFSKGKRGLYLLPLFPAASLLVGKLLHDFICSKMDYLRKEWIILPLYVLLGGMLVAGVLIPWYVLIKFSTFMPYSLPLAFLLIGGSLTMFILYHFKNHKAMVLLLIGILALGSFYTTRVIFPLINPHKSTRFISQAILSKIQPGQKLAVYGRVSAAPFNFYTGIVPIADLADPESLIQFLNTLERVFCLVTFEEWRKLQSMGGKPELHLIARYPLWDNDLVLISNR